MRCLPSILLLLLALLPTAVVGVADGVAQPPENSRNESYVDPDLDMQRMIDRLERETREVFELRDEIVAALGIAPGETVADIGAGTGAFLDPLAEAVGEDGHLFAVEISIRFVEHLRQRANELSLDNVTTVLSAYDSATLPSSSVDLMYVCDTYHHFDDHEAMLVSMFDALVPGGEMVIVDFDRVEGQSRQWILDHVRASKDQFRAEIEAVGFEFVEEVRLDGMVDNFFLRFRRP